MQQVISPRGVITWSVLHRCVIMCEVLHGGCNMDFSKSRPEILHEIEYLVFHNYFVFFGKKTCSSEIHVFQSDQFSLLMYCCLLPSSATVKMDNEENMENAHYATNDDTPLWTINMGVSGWYDMWYEKCHIIIYNYLIGQYLLLSHQSIFIIISSVDNHCNLISRYLLYSHQSIFTILSSVNICSH